MKIPYTLFALFALLAGCATPYQKIGTDMTGGHSFSRSSTDVFKVEFLGNGFTQPKRASDFALLRAAEVCLEHNFKYFSVIGEGDLSSSEIIQTGGTSHTTGTVTSYGTYSGTTTYTPTTMPVFKPGSEITIRCYVSRPGGHAGKVEDAAAIVSSLRAQYKLDQGS
jgi:hypothetical protein